MTVVTPRSGFDLEYYLNRATGEKSAGGYYLNAAQQREPPGRWFGRGAEALGFADGQVVERGPYLAVFTRTGYHGRKVDDREPGHWERAGLVVTTWLQGTSRDGEPHDHSHNVIARMGRTDADGVWRAVDTMALRAQLGAMSAIVDARVQSALSREFGVRWAARADGMGHEIDGISQGTLDAFSTRGHTVTQAARRLAGGWERKHGRAPNAREMTYLSLKANKVTREGKEGQIDWDALAAEWDATIGGQLAQIAEQVCDFQARPADEAAAPCEDTRERAIVQAMVTVQARRSTWTRSELMKNLAWAMGQDFAHLDPDARQVLLVAMAEQALSVDHGVVCVEAPEWPPLPRLLVRELGGRSVFTRPGTTRYATRGQLAMEERMCQQAQRTGAPVLAREFCAAQLGADADTLDAQLGAAAHAPDEHMQTQDRRGAGQLTRTGLRMDQAAMIYEALTSARRVSVGVGPAGAGKTHAAAVGARAWAAVGGEVIGLTCAQAARDVLHAAGIKESYNTAKFLMKMERGHPVRPGTLFVIDEGSMVPMNHLARIIDLAEKHGGKVFVAGDHHQLAAVESGGGMTMLADHLGYTQLAVPVRFEAEWERDASLRLRQGDKSALEAYAEHGRIIGASREEGVQHLAAAVCGPPSGR